MASILFSTRTTGQSSRFTSESAKSSSAADIAMRPRSALNFFAVLRLRQPVRRIHDKQHRIARLQRVLYLLHHAPVELRRRLMHAGRIYEHHLRRGMARLALGLLLRGTSSTPRMRVRVVCGLWVTMASFCPSSAFSSVDLPAFGRPMMETNPERKAFPSLCSASLVEIATGRRNHSRVGKFRSRLGAVETWRKS